MMSRFAVAASLFLTFTATGLTAGTATQQLIITKDPQAVSILTNGLNAAGGITGITAIQDFTATGTITYSWAGQQVPGPVTVKGRGSDQFRLDATLTDGTLPLVTSHMQGSLKKANGSVSSVPFSALVNFGTPTLVFPELTAALADPLTSIFYMGSLQIGGLQMYQIRIARNLDATEDPDGTLGKLRTKDIFIDSSSFLPFKAADTVQQGGNSGTTYKREYVFSDYRKVLGIQIPYHVVEAFAGQQTWMVQLDSITFNSGLSDADFQP
jgi:hypothetical protein